MRTSSILATLISILVIGASAFAQAPTDAEFRAAFPELAQHDNTKVAFITDPNVRLRLPEAPVALEGDLDEALGRVRAAHRELTLRQIGVQDQRTAIETTAREAAMAEELARRATFFREEVNAMRGSISAADFVLTMKGATDEIGKWQSARDEASKKHAALSADLAGAEIGAADAGKDLAEKLDAADKLWRQREELRAQSEDKKLFYDGLPVQRNTILLRFKESATIDQINALRKKYELTMRGGVLSIRLFITELPPESGSPTSAMEIARLHTVIDLLKAEDIVDSAGPNVLLGPMIVTPPVNRGIPRDLGSDHCWNWYAPCGGIAASKMIRFPEAWNFAAGIRRRGRSPVDVAVLDEGFARHEDLQFSSACTDAVSDHGNHVLGIIGARFGNRLGVDGGAPFANLIACAPRIELDATVDGLKVAFSEILTTLDELLARTSARIVNVSLGYNWFLNFLITPSENEDVKAIVRAQGSSARALLQRHRNLIVTSAAGNDCLIQLSECNDPAMWTSPFNWAALGPADSLPPARNVLVVESADEQGNRSSFSNAGGTIRAPGEHVYSTVASDLKYDVKDGTSMAAPGVAAVVALMFAYNPSLSVDEIRSILGVREGETDPPIEPPIVNAFKALAASRPEAMIDLADLNDDGRVGMEDFRLFQSNLRDVEGRRFRRDLNQDGARNSNDTFFPRSDLNGDGILSRTQTSFVPGLGEVTDLQVMMHAWQDKRPASDLPGLLLR